MIIRKNKNGEIKVFTSIDIMKRIGCVLILSLYLFLGFFNKPELIMSLFLILALSTAFIITRFIFIK